MFWVFQYREKENYWETDSGACAFAARQGCRNFFSETQITKNNKNVSRRGSRQSHLISVRTGKIWSGDLLWQKKWFTLHLHRNQRLIEKLPPITSAKLKSSEWISSQREENWERKLSKNGKLSEKTRFSRSVGEENCKAGSVLEETFRYKQRVA